MDTLEVLLTIVASVAAGALAVVGAANNIDWLWSKIYRERARRLEDAIDYLEDQGDLKTPARITPFSRDLILQTKIRYYGGASSTLSSTSLFDCVSQGIAVERTSYREALRIIADGQSKQLLHLEIVGSPCSGRSTMLVRLSLKLREQHPDTVLWLHGNRINDSFDIGKLDDFRRLKHRATKATQAARRFIVVIDNFIPDEAFSAARTERETLLESRRRFLTRLREKCESHAGLPTVVITSARASAGLDWSIALLLKLSKEDEAAILNALTSTDPPLVIENRSVSLSDIWGLLGGEPQYKGSLETFLAQLVVHVDHQDYIAESRHTLEELRWDDTNRDAAKCIAACQLLDLEVPARVLGMALGSLRVSELEKEGKGHIRINRGKLSLSAPYTASFLLQNHFRVTSVESLREVFVSLFAAWLNTNASEWRSEEVEFFRHVLYRLARPGRFLLLTTEDGIQIANSLFGQSTEKLGDFVLGQEDAKFLSEWALTLQRIGQNELPAKAVERALRMQRGRINDMQCFVSLCTVLSRMQSDHNTRRLRDAALSVLSLQSLLSNYARNHAQIEANVELHRRANEAISAYCSPSSCINFHMDRQEMA